MRPRDVASERRTRRARGLGLAFTLALAASLATPAAALKVATWNLLQYPGISIAGRQANFRTVIAALNPDILITQEINTVAGRDSFLNNVLNVVHPGQWTGIWVNVGSGEGGAVFWKPAAATVSNVTTAPTPSGPRNPLACQVRLPGYGTSTVFRLYSVHLKAGQTASDSAQRRAECTELRTYLNNVPTGLPFLLGGDTNFYGAYEGGYLRLLEDQADNDGRCFDYVSLPGVWNQSGYRFYHSQSPCLSGCIGGGSTGGLDDRFDFWLASEGMNNGEGIAAVPGTVTPFGNDGNHYNQDVDGGGTNSAVPIAVASAIKAASDHLPVFVIVQVPAKISVAPTLDCGTGLVNGSLGALLTVSNSAIAPADELTYSFTSSPVVLVPPDTFTAESGTPTLNGIAIDTSTPGQVMGTLTVNSDDPDNPAVDVTVTANVLRRASPSLDSLNVLTTMPLDLGEHAPGEFPDGAARVHNQAFDAQQQAQLEVYAAAITGGGGRFSIVGGFSPVLLGSVGQTYAIHFNDAGAALDSTYTATLTIQSFDDSNLSGADAHVDLTVALSARPSTGATGVAGGLPTAVRFLPPRPNPFHAGTRFAFELPATAHVALEIVDAAGRRVRTLANGTRDAGRFEIAWDGAGANGRRVAAGLYFARFAAPGYQKFFRIVALP